MGCNGNIKLSLTPYLMELLDRLTQILLIKPKMNVMFFSQLPSRWDGIILERKKATPFIVDCSVWRNERWQMLTEKDHFRNSLKWMRSPRLGQVFLSATNWNFKLIEHAQGTRGSNINYWHFVRFIDTSLLTLLVVKISFSFTDIKLFVAHS